MDNGLAVIEALRYFGLEEDIVELHRLIVDHDIDVELDDDGLVLSLNADDCIGVLIAEFERKMGHRPDDPEKVRAAKMEIIQKQEEARVERRMKRKFHMDRRRVSPLPEGAVGTGSLHVRLPEPKETLPPELREHKDPMLKLLRTAEEADEMIRNHGEKEA